jgi:hypothetical protein
MLHRVSWLSLSVLAFVVLSTSMLLARDGDRVHVGQSIVVGEGESAGDLVCVGCSIRMDGSCGDVVAIGGSIMVNGSVNGDVVTIGGSIRLDEDAAISGDVTTIGGKLIRHPDAVIRGNVSSQSGTLVLAALFFLPLIPVVLVVALIIWLVGRNRQRPGPAGVRAA